MKKTMTKALALIAAICGLQVFGATTATVCDGTVTVKNDQSRTDG